MERLERQCQSQAMIKAGEVSTYNIIGENGDKNNKHI